MTMMSLIAQIESADMNQLFLEVELQLTVISAVSLLFQFSLPCIS